MYCGSKSLYSFLQLQKREEEEKREKAKLELDNNNNHDDGAAPAPQQQPEETTPPRAVVIDSGSRFTRAGFAGEEVPRSSTLLSVIGRPKRPQAGAVQNWVAGKQAIIEEIESLNLKYPITHGLVTDADNLAYLWHHIYANELRVSSEEHPVIVTEVALSPKILREKIIQILFEDFNVPAAFVGIQQCLAMYATGRVTGLAVDLGDASIRTVPMLEGYALPHAILREDDVSGKALTEDLIQRLEAKGFSATSFAQRETVYSIKENFCYVANDFQQESSIFATNPHSIEKNYELPDGQTITIGEERFATAELLFMNTGTSKHMCPLPQQVHHCIMKCADAVPADVLASNVVLCGGTSLLPGLADRLHRELVSLTGLPVKITTPADRQTLGWQGGSILGSLSTFQQMYWTKEEYNESGPSVVHYKPF